LKVSFYQLGIKIKNPSLKNNPEQCLHALETFADQLKFIWRVLKNDLGFLKEASKRLFSKILDFLALSLLLTCS